MLEGDLCHLCYVDSESISL